MTPETNAELIKALEQTIEGLRTGNCTGVALFAQFDVEHETLGINRFCDDNRFEWQMLLHVVGHWLQTIGATAMPDAVVTKGTRHKDTDLKTVRES